MWSSPDDRRRRAIITRLMCQFSVDVGAGFDAELRKLEPMVDDGLVELEAAIVRMTPLGRYFVRNAAMAFDAHLSASAAGKFSKAV